MRRRLLLRSLLAGVGMAAALALAGCDTDSLTVPSGRALAPLSDKMLADIDAKNMAKESPILVRLFKEEVRARGLEAGQYRALRPAEDLSDLPLVG